MNIKVVKLEEAGYNSALRGIALNKEQALDNMPAVALKLSRSTAGSHRKFLRQIVLWWQLTLPRHVWCEFDTYKVGVVRNSGSTMHNIHKRPFEETDFVRPMRESFLLSLNYEWANFKEGRLTLHEFKDLLPEGYLQTSIITMNYEVLRTIYNDRINHRMPEWKEMLTQMLAAIEHPELIIKGGG